MYHRSYILIVYMCVVHNANVVLLTAKLVSVKQVKEVFAQFKALAM